MKTSMLIGRQMVHATDPDITGEVTDVLFDLALGEVAFFLADITLDTGTAAILFSPTVLIADADLLRISAHPDDIAARHDASMHRVKVPVDTADLPSIFIGPFGNTFSPSMIGALFNARIVPASPKPPTQENGVWFSELQGHGVRAHVGDVGHVRDLILDDRLAVCEGIEIATVGDASHLSPPADIHVQRSADNSLSLTIAHTNIIS